MRHGKYREKYRGTRLYRDGTSVKLPQFSRLHRRSRSGGGAGDEDPPIPGLESNQICRVYGF